MVFPKLNWSAPRDATWINAGENLKCMSPGEVIMLIKSSDFAIHDLCHAFDCCHPAVTCHPPCAPCQGASRWPCCCKAPVSCSLSSTLGGRAGRRGSQPTRWAS